MTYPSIKPKLRCGELQYNDSSVDTSLIWILFTRYFPIAFAEQCLDDEWTCLLTFGEFSGAICFMLMHMLTLSVVVVVAIGIGWVMKSSLQLISDSCKETQKVLSGFCGIPCGSLVNNVYPHYTFPTFVFTLI